jgi:WD40 repeat protein
MSSVVCLQQIGDHQLASGSEDGTVKIWEIIDSPLTGLVFNCSHTLPSQSTWLKSIYALGNYLLATGHADGKIQFWNLDNLDQPIKTFVGHSEIVLSMQS